MLPGHFLKHAIILHSCIGFNKKNALLCDVSYVNIWIDSKIAIALG